MKTKKVKHKKELLLKRATKSLLTTTFFLTLFLTSFVAKAQDINVNNGQPYGCNANIELVADASSVDLANSTFAWDATGALTFRRAGNTGSGSRSLTITGDNKINLNVRGEGKVFLKITDNSTAPATVIRYDVDISPTGNVINPTYSVKYGNINAPDYIKTRNRWIPLDVQSNNNQVVTIVNDQMFSVVWFASGGVNIVNQNNVATLNGNGKYEVNVTIASDGSINKGFLRASFIDTCTGVCGGGSYINWEILKNFTPDGILGVTCLRDNNLDDSKSTVYAVLDEVASNGIFDWEILETDQVTAFDTSKLKIDASELYGNAAVVFYQDGYSPSNVGNFVMKITNTVFGEYSFYREITSSPDSPKTAQQVYCANASLGAIISLEVDNPEPNKIYTWTVSGDKDWVVTPTTSNGSQIEVTFNDNESGVLNVKATDQSEPECDSSPTAVFVNRVGGGTVSIDGPNCVPNDAVNAFTFTASPFAKYEWNIPSEILDDSNGWDVQIGSNTLTLTPPASGINQSTTGQFNISATLNGCTGAQTANFSFEVAPLSPIVTGAACAIPSNNYTYNIDYKGATTAEVTVLNASKSTVLTKTISSPSNFDFTAINGDYEIQVVTYSNASCRSLPTSFNVKALLTPEVTGDSCVIPGNSYTYNIDYKTITSAEVTVTDAAGTVLRTENLIAPNNFTYIAPSSDFEIEVVTYLDSSCRSLPASLNVKAAPSAPLISGPLCVIPNNNYDYTIDYNGASNAEVSVLDGSGTIVQTATISSPSNFNFTAISSDFTIQAVTYDEASCKSLPNTLDVKVAPSKPTITETRFGCDNQAEFTASSTGNVTNYQWNIPNNWTIIGGAQGSDTIILQLDGNGGDITVTPDNNGCVGESTTQNVSPPSLIRFAATTVGGGVGTLLSVESDSPVIITWFQAQNAGELDEVACTGGTPYDFNDPLPTTNSSLFAFTGLNDWIRVVFENPATGCTKCMVFNASTPPGQSAGPKAAPTGDISKRAAFTSITTPTPTNLNVKAYPNPTSNTLNIEIPTKQSLGIMALVDLKGRVVFKKQAAMHKETINTSEYAKGTYLLLIQTKDGYSSKKIIIK